MPIQLPEDSPLPAIVAELAHVPVERIEHLIIIISYDTGVAMLHDACCNVHARAFLATIAATPPDVVGTERFTGSN